MKTMNFVKILTVLSTFFFDRSRVTAQMSKDGTMRSFCHQFEHSPGLGTCLVQNQKKIFWDLKKNFESDFFNFDEFYTKMMNLYDNCEF